MNAAANRLAAEGAARDLTVAECARLDAVGETASLMEGKQAMNPHGTSRQTAGTCKRELSVQAARADVFLHGAGGLETDAQAVRDPAAYLGAA